VSAVAALLAAAAGRPPTGVVTVGAAVLAGQLSIGWSNDARDVERDRATGRTDKPVATGQLSAGSVWGAAGLAAATCVPLSLLSGWRAALAHLTAVSFAWAYNLGAKATALSVLPYAVAFGLLPAFVTLGLSGHPAPPAWAVLGGALLGAGAHLANALPDLAGDLHTGVRGLPHRLGASPTRAGAAVLLVGAALVITLGPGRPGALALGGLTVSTAFAGAGLIGQARRPGSRLAFRGVLLAALVDVALLLARAGRLR